MDLVEVPCPVCLSGDSRHVFSVRDYVLRITDDTFGVRQCRRCGVGFLSPRPKAADIPHFYPDEFYWTYEKAEEGGVPAAELLARREVQIEGKLRLMAHLRPGRLLDIGAMKGEFLHVARERGWRVSGVEFSDEIPNPFDVPMQYGEFTKMDFPPGSFDCVTMWAVLEHVYEPRAYVQEVSRVMADGGTFIGVVTNFNSVQARLLRADDYPRHLTLFTKRSLKRLLTGAGLTPVRMWTDQRLFGGQLRGALKYAVKRGLGYTVDEALYEMRNVRDPLEFCSTFKGRKSAAMLWLSRIENIGLALPERLLDFMGFGMNLGFEARKLPKAAAGRRRSEGG
jgi:SAM-dependent methyltransferase